MLTFNEVAGPVQGAETARVWSVRPKLNIFFFLLLTGFASLFTKVAAQNIPLDSVPYQFSFDQSFYDEEEEIEITLELGNPNEPLSGIIGTELQLIFDTSLLEGHEVTVSLENSWLFDPANCQIGTSWNGDTLQVSVQSTEANPPTGWGDALQIKLICGTNGVTPNTLMSIGGGFITVEDIDMRPQVQNRYAVDTLALNPAEITFKIWPNPASSEINLQYAQGTVQEVNLLDATGRIVRREIAPGDSYSSIAVENLPSGTYFLEIISKTGQREVQRVLIQ